MSQDVNGLVIEAKFLKKSANLLENNCCGFNNTWTKIYHIWPFSVGGQ